MLLRAFVVQVFYIPSSSMVPTLAVDDRIIVEKVGYRFGEPRRGDVVVFAGAGGAVSSTDGSGPVTRALRALGTAVGIVPPEPSDLVKRLMGLPGDEIEISEGLLRINGVVHEEAYLTGAPAADFGPVIVPEGTFFFLGDNRRNSADSRGSLGFVDRDRVIGRAVAVLWPPGNMASLLGQRPEPLGPRSSDG